MNGTAVRIVSRIVHNCHMQESLKHAMTLGWRHPFDALGTEFYSSVNPTALSNVHWVAKNHALARAWGWPDDAFDDHLLNVLSGNAVAKGSQPCASVYSGHQFGVWAGQLGDGRALSLGMIDTPLGAQEIQLKGAGKTPYSRMGDGRAVLRSSIREFLCSEAMHGLRIPTTRALALVGSPDRVLREDIETAAVVHVSICAKFLSKKAVYPRKKSGATKVKNGMCWPLPLNRSASLHSFVNVNVARLRWWVSPPTTAIFRSNTPMTPAPWTCP